ncbi:MAG: FadR family transcriptional regulator [Proteobacteria bacterium]|nr:FadR family transcriptional regulator [Pseudomonadota bacterium]
MNSQRAASRNGGSPLHHPVVARGTAGNDAQLFGAAQPDHDRHAPIDADETRRVALIRIRDMIENGQLKAAGRLPAERVLARSIGVSRRSLRHALGVLEAEGRIMRHQGRGTFVADRRHATQDLVSELSKLTNPVDALEARLALEPPQARLAALRATRGDIDKLFEAAEASRVARDPASYEKADAAFHRRVAMATRNPLMIAIFEAVLETAQEGSWRHGRETAHCIHNQAAYAADHRRIAVAIAERNAARAEETMRTHLSKVQQRLIEHAFPRSPAGMSPESDG